VRRISRGETPSARQIAPSSAAVGGDLKRSTVSNGTFFFFRKSTDFRQVLQVGLT
jgi:hypothetical protein